MPLHFIGEICSRKDYFESRGGPGVVLNAFRIAFCTSIISDSSLYGWRGQKNPFRPSFFLRGTIWTCRCGTLWLTRLLMATNEPSARMPVSIALARRWAEENSGA